MKEISLNSVRYWIRRRDCINIRATQLRDHLEPKTRWIAGFVINAKLQSREVVLVLNPSDRNFYGTIGSLPPDWETSEPHAKETDHLLIVNSFGCAEPAPDHPTYDDYEPKRVTAVATRKQSSIIKRISKIEQEIKSIKLEVARPTKTG